MDYKQELEKIENKVSENKENKVRLEERLKHLKEEKEQLLANLKEEKVEEGNLKDVITDLEIEIEEELVKCKNLLKEVKKDEEENKEVVEAMVKGDI